MEIAGNIKKILTKKNKNFSIDERRKIFREKIEVRILISFILLLILGFTIYLLGAKFSFNSSIGIFIMCLSVIILFTIRNYYFAKQTTYDEFISANTYISLIKWLILIMISYVIIVINIPKDWIEFSGKFKEYQSLIQICIFSLLGVIIVMINLYLPWWLRSLDIRKGETEEIKKLYARLDGMFKDLDLLGKSKSITEKDIEIINSRKYKEHVALLKLEIIEVKNVVEFIALCNYINLTRGEIQSGQKLRKSLSIIGYILSIGFSIIKFGPINIIQF